MIHFYAFLVGAVLILAFTFIPALVGHVLGDEKKFGDKWALGIFLLVVLAFGLLIAYYFGTIVLEIAGVNVVGK